MKITTAEFKILEALECVSGGQLLICDLNKKALVTAAWMAGKGLLRAREWDEGSVVATALGRRCYSRRAALPRQERSPATKVGE